MTPKVCAVIVTYNRKDLLQECLAAVQAQTRPADEVVVVNNASTDGTDQLLQDRFSAVRVLGTSVNYGGAGGFHAGIRWAYNAGFDWIWVMDDDACPDREALERLLAAMDRVVGAERPGILASRVVWEDGRLHPMNSPSIETRRTEWSCIAATARAVAIRSASFVSIAIHRTCVEQQGLPIADYFIWNDDAEYTARVLNHRLGLLVPDSIVVHKTSTPYTSTRSAGSRYYYELRNKLWMVLRSGTYSRADRIALLYWTLFGTLMYLKFNRLKPRAFLTVARGGAAGLFRKPRDLNIEVREVRSSDSRASI